MQETLQLIQYPLEFPLSQKEAKLTQLAGNPEAGYTAYIKPTHYHCFIDQEECMLEILQ